MTSTLLNIAGEIDPQTVGTFKAVVGGVINELGTSSIVQLLVARHTNYFFGFLAVYLPHETESTT